MPEKSWRSAPSLVQALPSSIAPTAQQALDRIVSFLVMYLSPCEMRPDCQGRRVHLMELARREEAHAQLIRYGEATLDDDSLVLTTVLDVRVRASAPGARPALRALSRNGV
jgi:hypothetical protein